MIPPAFNYKMVLSSVLILQCVFRVFLAKVKVGLLRERRRCAVIIQCLARVYLAKHLVVSHREKQRHFAATKVQTCVRRFLWSQTWKNYGSKPFDCAVTLTMLLSYFDGAADLRRSDVEWFIQLSHVHESVDESWLVGADGKPKAPDRPRRTASFILQHQDNVSLAVHRTTVVSGGPDSAKKVEGKR